MSEQGSDSEAKDWTVVNKEGEVDGSEHAEGSDDASSNSSLEFVQLDEDAARFRLRSRTTSKSSDRPDQLDQPGGIEVNEERKDNVTHSVSSTPELVSPSDNEEDENPMAEDSVVPKVNPDMTDSKGSDSDASSLEVIGPEDVHESQSEAVEGKQDADKNTTTEIEHADSQSEVLLKEEGVVASQKEMTHSHSKGELEKSTEKSEGDEYDIAEDEMEDSDQEDDGEEDDDEQRDMVQQMPEPQPGCSNQVPCIDLNSSSDDPPVIAKMKAYLKQFSDSDSDSDFVRLDAGVVEEGAVGGVAAAEIAPLMNSSSSSMATSSSSVSSNFRFIHPFAMPAAPHPFQIQPQQDPDNEDDNDPAPSDVDDRCESDISGVAGDSSDLSSMLYQMGDAPLTADDVPRSYCHQPNERLDAILTTIALLALFLAVGIGIGHFIGTTRESALRKQYINRMKELQDDYLMCLRDQSILQNNIKKQPPMEEKFGFLMAAWQEKYQELLMEKANLEAKVADLERHLVDKEIQNSGTLPGVQTPNLMSMDNSPNPTTIAEEPSEAITIADNDDVDIMELEGHIAAVETLEQELKQRLEDSEKRLQEYVKLQAQATETIHALQTRLYQVDGEKQDLTQDVGELQAQHKQLQIHNTQLESEKKQLMTQNIHLKEDRSELQLINNQLESQNVALVSQLKEEQNQIEQLKTRLTNMEGAKMISEQKPEHEPEQQSEQKAEISDGTDKTNGEMELYTSIQKLKDDLNQVEQEKSELLTTLAKLRYMQHPGNPEAKPELEHSQQKNMKNQMNQLITENVDLKATVGKMRYSPPLTEDDLNVDEGTHESPTQERLTHRLIETQRQLAKEKDVSHLWQTLYVAEKVANEKRESTSSFMTCLSLLLPQVTPGRIGDWLLTNATQMMQLQWEFLQNVTTDTDFMKKLHDRWVDLQHYAGQASEDLKFVPDEALAVYSILQQALSARWESFLEANFTIPWLNEVFLNASHSEPFQTSVEQTRHTVRELKDTVHHTWEKVRDMSSTFLNQHKAKFDEVKDKVKKKLSDIGLKVQNKMQEAQETLKKSGLFERLGKEKPRKKRTLNDETRPRKEQESDRLHYEKTDDGKTNGKFVDKPSHKQTQSDYEVYKQYQEYWSQTGFEPDDILEEGFFQGNNREWRKHQMTLKQLHGRINRMNEDMITSMDDDEIEDIYDDLEDLQDDLDDSEHQPEKLKTWLTCQIRWWKSRFQRKKRDEDLIRGCGKQMMHWQLRVICKEVCGKDMVKGKGKPCKTCSAILSPNPQGFHNTHKKTVAASHSSPRSHDKSAEKAFTKSSNSGKPMDKHSSNIDKTQQDWMHFAVPETNTNFTMGPEGDWYLKRMMAREDNKGNSQWYISRMEGREDRRHDPLWYVRSMEEHSAEPKESFGFYGERINHDNDRKTRRESHKESRKVKHHLNGFDWEEHISEHGHSDGRRTVHHHYRYNKHHHPRHGRHARHHRSFS